ncbi:MAG: hypothetical protein ACM3NQ_03525 [Bacteroidales bacterium]
MRTTALLALVLLAAACGSYTPVPIQAGDICATCKQPITDVKFAAEAISPQGMVSKFRTPDCLARHIRQNPTDIAAKWVTDYATGRMIRPEGATYVRAVLNENTNERAYAAFGNVKDAVEFGKTAMSSPVDWLMIQRLSAEKKSD